MTQDRRNLTKIGVSILANIVGAPLIALGLILYIILIEAIEDRFFTGRNINGDVFGLVGGILMVVTFIIPPTISVYLLRKLPIHKFFLVLFWFMLLIINTVIIWGCLFFAYLYLISYSPELQSAISL